MKKILFIEDDLMVIRIYRQKFQCEGYEVEVATEGKAALEALKNNRPDLVLLDLQLPKFNGVEILKHIRATPDLKRLPVIVFTNAFTGQLMEEAWKAGATRVLTKASCAPRQLLEIVQTAINSSQHSPLMPQAPVAPASPAAPTPVVLQVSNLLGSLDRNDSKSHDIIRRVILETGPHTLSALRAHMMSMQRAAPKNGEQQPAGLMEMFRMVHSLTSNAGLAGLKRIAQLSSALEALIQDLHDKPTHINPSSLRTLATAVDALGALFESATDVSLDSCPSALALVVDDEALSRKAVCNALDKAEIRPITADDPAMALRLLELNKFDIVFLDVEMPGMNGFDLAKKLRAIPGKEHTPVIFVTNLNDFESRAKSTLSGGTDLIGKPFLLIELAVKALTCVLKPPPKPAGLAAAA